MTTIAIGSITIPAGADTTDALAALAAFFAGTVPANPTGAQLAEAIRLRDIDFIKRVTKDYRTKQAAIADPAAT